ncbi:MAG: hypothetical protein IT435_07900 [Phycisphaerales bacterium]|nr:hypothetical protein [Phycisphaerales bacterium]
MRITFYIDPDTDLPHVENHGIETTECVEVLENAGQDFKSRSGARTAYGQTRAGRYLKVVYRLDKDEDELLVITAYPIKGNEVKAYRRRLRRRFR